MMMRVENETPRKRKHSPDHSDSSISPDEVQNTPIKRAPATDLRTKVYTKKTPVKKATLEETLLDTYGEKEAAAHADFVKNFYTRSLTDEFMAEKPTTSSSKYNPTGTTRKDGQESEYDADESQLSEANCSQVEEENKQ